MKISNRAAWVLVCGGLAACSDAPPEGAAVTPPVASPSTNAQDAQSPFVSAVPVGDAVESLTVDFRVTDRPVAGAAAQVIVGVASAVDLESLALSVSSSQFDVQADPAALMIEPVVAGSRYEVPMTITPVAAGVGTVDVVVAMRSSTGGSEARLALPVLAVAAD